jgi:hypothetical protein
VVEHVIGRDERQFSRFAESSKAGETLRIVAAIEMVDGKIGAATEIRRDPSREIRSIRRLGRQHDNDLTFAMRNHISVVELAFAFRGAALPRVNSSVSRP